MTADDYEDDEQEAQSVICWPDNERAYGLWCKVANQWRTGMGGAFALDHVPLLHWLGRMALPEDEYEDLFSEIQVMESAALAAMQD